jgi:hypothetical protein
MRVRSGFVSNSSSTSFLILTADELTEAAFLDLMGAAPGSPLIPLFRDLYDQVMTKADVIDFSDVDKAIPPEKWLDGFRLSGAVIDRLESAKREGMHMYYGSLSSDGDRVESFFCTESFEAENEKIYANFLECGW